MTKTTPQERTYGFAAPRGRVYDSIVETVGGTPLVALPHLTREDGLQSRILMKLEFFNPLASVKDRIGAAMIEDAESRGEIQPGKTTLVEPTSGNTGISLAFVAVARGYRLIVTMPEGASIERRKMLRLLDAQLELTPSRLGMAGAIARAEEILKKTPNAGCRASSIIPPTLMCMPPLRRRKSVDTAGEVDIVVAGLGTGGTASGIAHGLKARKPGVQVYGVEPMESAILNGDEPGPHGIQASGRASVPARWILRHLMVSCRYRSARRLRPHVGVHGWMACRWVFHRGRHCMRPCSLPSGRKTRARRLSRSHHPLPSVIFPRRCLPVWSDRGR